MQRFRATDHVMNDTSIAVFIPDAGALHSIEEIAHITQVPRHTIAIYCRCGLLAPVGDPEVHGWFFDTDALRMLQQIEHLRRDRGVNLAGIRMVLELAAEVERLRAELRFVRGY